jgi:hypothetical protein
MVVHAQTMYEWQRQSLSSTRLVTLQNDKEPCMADAAAASALHRAGRRKLIDARRPRHFLTIGRTLAFADRKGLALGDEGS